MNSTRQQQDIPNETVEIAIRPAFGGFSVTLIASGGKTSQRILSTGDVTVGEDRTLTWYTVVDDADWSLAPDDGH